MLESMKLGEGVDTYLVVRNLGQVAPTHIATGDGRALPEHLKAQIRRGLDRLGCCSPKAGR